MKGTKIMDKLKIAFMQLFPEMWSCGYNIPEDISELKAMAVSSEGEFVRAFENMTAIATCNYPAGKPDCNGHSTLFDGVAYLPELPSSRDTCVLDAGENESIYIGELDLDMLKRYRETEVHGNAYRRPEKYSLLTSEEVKYPFVRSDKKR